MKVTKEQVIQIKELRKEGLSLFKISEKTGLKKTTIHYHLNPESKKQQSRRYWQSLSKEKQREIKRRYNKYQKDYQFKKYTEDEEFRERKKATAKKHYERKKK